MIKYKASTKERQKFMDKLSGKLYGWTVVFDEEQTRYINKDYYDNWTEPTEQEYKAFHHRSNRTCH